MNDAGKTAVCSFMGITHILVLFLRLSVNKGQILSPLSALGHACIWDSTRENLSSGFANLPRLISAFVKHFLESFLSKLVMSKISFFYLVCGWGDWFESHFIGSTEDRFSRIAAHMINMHSNKFIIKKLTTWTKFIADYSKTCLERPLKNRHKKKQYLT